MHFPVFKSDRLEVKRVVGALSLGFAVWALLPSAGMARSSAAPEVTSGTQRAGVAWDTFAHRNVQYLAKPGDESAADRQARMLAVLKAEALIPVKVGDYELKIPVPPGYVRVSPEMKAMHGHIMKLTQNGPHRHLITFMPVEQAPEALDGGIPALTSAFSVEVPRELEHRTTSTDTSFQGVKWAFRGEQNRIWETWQTATDSTQAVLQMTERSLLEGLGASAEIASILPERVHLESVWKIAASALSRLREPTAEQPERLVNRGLTQGFVRANDKVLYLQTMAIGDDALNLSRQAWQVWGEQVVALNPYAPADKEKAADGRVVWRDVVAMLGLLFLALIFYRVFRWLRK